MGKALKDVYVSNHYTNLSSFWPNWTLTPPYDEMPEEFKKKSTKRSPAKRKAAAAKSRARKRAM